MTDQGWIIDRFYYVISMFYKCQPWHFKHYEVLKRFTVSDLTNEYAIS